MDGAIHNVLVSSAGNILGATLVPEMHYGHNQSMDMKGLALFYNIETNELIKKVKIVLATKKSERSSPFAMGMNPLNKPFHHLI